MGKEDGKYEAGFKQNGKNERVIYCSRYHGRKWNWNSRLINFPLQFLNTLPSTSLGPIKKQLKLPKQMVQMLYEAEVKSGDALFDVKGNFVTLKKINLMRKWNIDKEPVGSSRFCCYILMKNNLKSKNSESQQNWISSLNQQFEMVCMDTINKYPAWWFLALIALSTLFFCKAQTGHALTLFH